MSASPQPLISRESNGYKRSRRRENLRSRTIPPTLEQPVVNKAATTQVDEKTTLPSHLRSLNALQKGLSVVTLSLMTSALGVYAWTVYVPKVWHQEYSKLETLQRYERSLLTTNETLKQQLAKQAEKPETGLTIPKPEQAIFLPLNPKSVTIKAKNSLSNEQPLKVTQPLAY
ncbi:MAG: hypothetical protein N5P05_001059 [Chroococcopsis gigantea SAG 12.99]|jgi:hypothetical protein|nr:hypothetical protein [Chlorogloea purpurea SAG 13.99]MDV2999453.1 hypothetical protein [Chroococcopsis gigantea SAG 12.99]